jgi:cyclin G-associated kinase
MSSFFKSALGLFGDTNLPNVPGPNQTPNNNSNSNITSNDSGQGNDFVGKTIQIGELRLRILKKIAEGGFAIVYTCQDGNGQQYALKRIFSADEDTNRAIREEISYLKKGIYNPFIIKFVQAACEDVQGSRGSKEFLILTELCKDPLVDHLNAGLSSSEGRAFNCEQVIKIFYQICRSVQYLHSQEPPIIHRDLKLENFLISKDDQIKLCDFGSATTVVYQPDNTWSGNKRSLIEDEIAKVTTPMYRAPEMLDLYLNYKIDSQADIWALGEFN